jgi:hypothetical protein
MKLRRIKAKDSSHGVLLRRLRRELSRLPRPIRLLVRMYGPLPTSYVSMEHLRSMNFVSPRLVRTFFHGTTYNPSVLGALSRAGKSTKTRVTFL